MGDFDGHPFRGNQYTRMASGAIKLVESGRSTGAGDYVSQFGGTYVKKMELSNETPHPPDIFHDEIVRQLEVKGFTKVPEERRQSYGGDKRTVMTKPGVGTHTVEKRHLGVIPGDYAKGYRGRNEVRIDFKREKNAWVENPPKAL